MHENNSLKNNIEGQVELLWGTLKSEGWLSLISVEWVTFQEVDLPIDSNDREVWRFAQANNLILLTTNRSMKDENSLEQTLREENMTTSLPVLTIGHQERILYDSVFKNNVQSDWLMLDLENYLGTRRIFIP